MSVFTVILLSPFIALAVALARAAIFVFPATLLLGALHSHIPEVPALGWKPVFFIIALAYLLVGSWGATDNSKG